MTKTGRCQQTIKNRTAEPPGKPGSDLNLTVAGQVAPSALLPKNKSIPLH